MTLAAFSALLIASGYLWLRLWLLTRALLTRGDSNSLYFVVVLAAFCLGLCAYGLAVGLGRIPVVGLFLYNTGTSFLSPVIAESQITDKILRFALLAAFAPVSALLLAFLLNRPLSKNGELANRLIVRLRSRNELDCLLTEAAQIGLPVMVTTSSGKVYVGYGIDLPDAGGARDWIRLEPMLSGYRNDQHEFVPTTNYSWIHSLPSRGTSRTPQRCVEDFDLLIAADDIRHFHKFDLEAYLHEFKSDRPRPAHPKSRVRTFRNHIDQPTKAEWLYFVYVITLVSALILFGLYVPLSLACGYVALLTGWGSLLEEEEDNGQAEGPDKPTPGNGSDLASVPEPVRSPKRRRTWRRPRTTF